MPANIKSAKSSRNSAEHAVYEYVCRKPGLSTYELSKRLKMSGGNVRDALTRLQRKGLVRFKFDKSNPRIRKLTYPVSAWELLPRSLKVALRKLKS